MQNVQRFLIKNLIRFSIFRLETMYNFRLHSVEVRAVVLYTFWVWCILVLSQKSQTRTHMRERATNKLQKKRKKNSRKNIKIAVPLGVCVCIRVRVRFEWHIPPPSRKSFYSVGGRPHTPIRVKFFPNRQIFFMEHYTICVNAVHCFGLFS